MTDTLKKTFICSQCCYDDDSAKISQLESCLEEGDGGGLKRKVKERNRRSLIGLGWRQVQARE